MVDSKIRGFLWIAAEVVEHHVQGDGRRGLLHSKRPVQETVDASLRRSTFSAAIRQLAVLGKADIGRMHEPLNKWLGTEFGIHVPFPNDEERHLESLSGIRIAQTKKQYP